MHDGCELLTGGESLPGLGYYFEPTVLKVNDDSLEIIKEETFGPVLPIRVVKDEEERSGWRTRAITGWVPRSGPAIR